MRRQKSPSTSFEQFNLVVSLCVRVVRVGSRHYNLVKCALSSPPSSSVNMHDRSTTDEHQNFSPSAEAAASSIFKFRFDLLYVWRLRFGNYIGIRRKQVQNSIDAITRHTTNTEIGFDAKVSKTKSRIERWQLENFNARAEIEMFGIVSSMLNVKRGIILQIDSVRCNRIRFYRKIPNYSMAWSHLWIVAQLGACACACIG